MVSLLILDHLLKRAEDFRNAYRLIHEFSFDAEIEPVEVDSLKELIAI